MHYLRRSNKESLFNRKKGTLSGTRESGGSYRAAQLVEAESANNCDGESACD